MKAAIRGEPGAMMLTKAEQAMTSPTAADIVNQRQRRVSLSKQADLFFAHSHYSAEDLGSSVWLTFFC